MQRGAAARRLSVLLLAIQVGTSFAALGGKGRRGGGGEITTTGSFSMMDSLSSNRAGNSEDLEEGVLQDARPQTNRLGDILGGQSDDICKFGRTLDSMYSCGNSGAQKAKAKAKVVTQHGSGWLGAYNATHATEQRRDKDEDVVTKSYWTKATRVRMEGCLTKRRAAEAHHKEQTFSKPFGKRRFGKRGFLKKSNCHKSIHGPAHPCWRTPKTGIHAVLRITKTRKNGSKEWVDQIRPINSLCTSCKVGHAFVVMDSKLKLGTCTPYRLMPYLYLARLGKNTFGKPTKLQSGLQDQSMIATKVILSRGIILLHYLKGKTRAHFSKVMDKRRKGLGRRAIAECFVRKETVCHGTGKSQLGQKCQVRKQVKCHRVCVMTAWKLKRMAPVELNQGEKKVQITNGMPAGGECHTSLCDGEYGALACKTAAVTE